jgi:hypothetical protein
MATIQASFANAAEFFNSLLDKLCQRLIAADATCDVLRNPLREMIMGRLRSCSVMLGTFEGVAAGTSAVVKP